MYMYSTCTCRIIVIIIIYFIALDVHILTPKDLVMNSIEVYKSELSRWYSSTPTLLASVAEEEEGKEEGGGVKSAGEKEGSETEGKVEEEETENQAPIEVMFKFKGFNDTTLLYSYLSLSLLPLSPVVFTSSVR